MAKLIHREINPARDMATHVYDNGDVWQISKNDTGTFANRITHGYMMRWFPSAYFVGTFGYPDDWKV